MDDDASNEVLNRIAHAVETNDPWLVEFNKACRERDAAREVMSKEDFEKYQKDTAWHRDPEGNETNPDVECWLIEEDDSEEIWCPKGIHRYVHKDNYSNMDETVRGAIFDCMDCGKEIKVPDLILPWSW